MTLIVNPLTLPENYEHEAFTDTITVTAELASGDAGGGTTPVSITTCTVTPDYTEAGVTISISTLPSLIVIITIFGMYTEIFTDKYIDYKYKINDPVTRAVRVSDIPPNIYALTHYSPDMRRIITVSFDINTDQGSAIVTKVIRNNWSNGAAIIADLNSRGVV